MELVITGNAANHIGRVLRLSVGDSLILFHGDGVEFDATLAAVQRNGIRLEVGDAREVQRESPLRLTLLQGICRGQKMDLVIQKGTELGVSANNVYTIKWRLTDKVAAKMKELLDGVE